MKILLGTKIFLLYRRNNVKSGYVIAGFHCTCTMALSLDLVFSLCAIQYMADMARASPQPEMATRSTYFKGPKVPTAFLKMLLMSSSSEES